MVEKQKFYTDYPMAEMGDIVGDLAPIRECELLAYDRDKYVLIRFSGITKGIKAGYIYTEAGRYGEVPRVGTWHLLGLPTTFNGVRS